MVPRTITLGERQFQVGPITLGTVRRAPDAFRIAAKIRPPAEDGTVSMPTPEQFDAMVTLIHDNINALTPGVATVDDLNAIVNELDFIDGVKQISDAIVAIMSLTKKRISAGNSESQGS